MWHVTVTCFHKRDSMVATWLWHLTEQRIDRQGNIDNRQNSIYLDAARRQRVTRWILKLVPFSSSLFIITLCTLFIYSIHSRSLSLVISYFCKEALISKATSFTWKHSSERIHDTTRLKHSTRAFSLKNRANKRVTHVHDSMNKAPPRPIPRSLSYRWRHHPGDDVLLLHLLQWSKLIA